MSKINHSSIYLHILPQKIKIKKHLTSCNAIKIFVVWPIYLQVEIQCQWERPARQIFILVPEFLRELCIRQVIFTSIPDMGTKFNGYFTQVYGLFGSSD